MQRDYKVGDKITWHMVEGMPDPCDEYITGYVSDVRDDGKVVVKTTGNNNGYDDMNLLVDDSNEDDFIVSNPYLTKEDIRDLLFKGQSFTEVFPYLCKPGYYFKSDIPRENLSACKDAVVYYPTVFEVGTLYYQQEHLNPSQRNDIVRHCVTVEDLMTLCNDDEKVVREVHKLLKGEKLISSSFDKVYQKALNVVNSNDIEEGMVRRVHRGR